MTNISTERLKEITPELLAATSSIQDITFRANELGIGLAKYPVSDIEAVLKFVSASMAEASYRSPKPPHQEEGIADIVARLSDWRARGVAGVDADAAASALLSQASQIEALRKERTKLIETKREQIERLTTQLQHVRDLAADDAAEAKKVCDSYADENQRLFDRAEAAETKLAEAIKVIERIVDCADRNYGRQNEKLADIAPMGRSFLDANGGAQ